MKKMKAATSMAAFAAILTMFALFELGHSDVLRMKTGGGGGLRDVDLSAENGDDVVSLARFAVLEQNKRQNSLLEFARVIKAKEQVVAGMMYHLTLEVIDAGKTKICEAKVWVKPWMNFKKLQEFKDTGVVHSVDLPSHASERGWKPVSAHDQLIQVAARYAVQRIQQVANSLIPYELQDILQAKTKVIENYINLELLLKVQRGSIAEKFRVQLRRSIEGKFHLIHMEQVRF